MNFKIGNWVVDHSNNDYIGKITEIVYEMNSDIAIFWLGDDYTVSAECVSKWQPKEDEWCWFYHDDVEYGVLGQFLEKNQAGYMTKHGGLYDNCVPFPHELPSFIKDRK